MPVNDREHLIAVAKAVAANPCNCQRTCGDVDDEVGVCIGLHRPTELGHLPTIVMEPRA